MIIADKNVQGREILVNLKDALMYEYNRMNFNAVMWEQTDKIASLTKDLKIAVKFLRDGKLKFAPNTTNSDVDLFIEKHRSLLGDE